MKFSVTNFVWMAVVALSAFGLYLVKYSVQEVQRDVAKLEAKLAKEKETVHLLEAEWAYLNRPERLRKLAEGRVDVRPVASANIIDVTRLPSRALSVAETQAEIAGEMLHKVSAGGMYVPVVAR